jgi:hypothetical protein
MKFSNKILLEHNDFTPGDFYGEDTLIIGGVGAILNEMVSLNEATDLGKPLKFRGKFQEAEAINKNKRMYPYAVLNGNVVKLQETIDSGGLIGEMDHPQDSIIHFANASHKITKLWWENNTLMGEGVILNTPAGKILRALINDGVRIGISSRGVGNGKVNEDGILVIGESYKLITFDAVADPSTYSAFQKKVSSESVVIPQNIVRNSVKNEARSVDKINSNILLACFNGLIRKQVNELKK